MPLFRGRHTSCFYCGQRFEPPPSTSYHPNRRVRHFCCPFCNADNHYDEHGELIDYVPESSLPTPRYGRRRSSPRSLAHVARPRSDPSPSREPLFCRTCENNQIIVNNAIATYDFLPEDDPNYENQVQYHFARYKKSLEERYPQVCANCAPKVNERIKRTNYSVKASSLGQMLARSSAVTKSRTSGGFNLARSSKILVWYIRGFLWNYTHVIMLVWHGSAMLLPQGSQDPVWTCGGWDACVLRACRGWVACLLRSISRGSMDQACYAVATSQARVLPWSILAFNWIYRERELERHPEKRLVGAREYLKLEVFIYVFRLLSWWLLEPGRVELTETARRSFHIGVFFVSLFATLFSVTCLKLEDPPNFSLKEPEPVTGTPDPTPPSSPPSNYEIPPLHRQEYRQPSPPRPLQSHPYQPQQSFTPKLHSSSQAFPSFTPTKSPSGPFTHDDDAMDWNPTVPSPAKNNSIWKPRDPATPSPFVGNIPAAPKPPAHQLVSSLLPQPALRPAEQTPVNFFTHRNAQQQAPQAKPQKFTPFAPPKFQVDSDTTGLEGLLGPGLSLNDAPEMPAASLRERETWDVISGRFGLLWTAVGIWCFFDRTDSRFLPPTLLTFEALWMGFLKEGIVQLFAVILGGLSFVTAIAALVESYTALSRQITGLLLFTVGVWEVWGLMMKLQAMRKREFWREETRRAVAQEQRQSTARRRTRAPSPPSGGGFSGLSLGSGPRQRF